MKCRREVVQIECDSVRLTGSRRRFDNARELLAMGLRPATGIDRRRIETVADRALPQTKIDVFVDEGWMVQDGSRIALTAKGRLLADALTAELSP